MVVVNNFGITTTVMNREKKEIFFLPLPIRSDKHQFLGLGFGWQNVDFSDYRINGDNLYNVKEKSLHCEPAKIKVLFHGHSHFLYPPAPLTKINKINYK